MNGANQDELRLMPLLAAVESIAKPAFNLEQILSLAVMGEVCLYVQLPPERVVYVDPRIPIITRRRSGAHFELDWGLSFYSSRSGLIHPEVTHLALDPDQAEDLKQRKSTDEMVFCSGLSLHPDGILAEAGWLVPCQFGASLVVCSASLSTEVEKNRRSVRRVMLRSTLEDILVDERILDLLDGSQGSRNDDPFGLRARSPGMYVLYCAAKRYHAALKAKAIDIEMVESDVLKQLPSLGKTRVARVVNLINPWLRRNSGVAKDDQVVLGADILHRPSFRRKYLAVGFMTEALALVLYVAERWHEAHTGRPSGSDRLQLEADFKEVGFYQKESEALATLTFWPVR